MRFGHVAIRVKDIEGMLDFYCRGLGLKEAFRISNDDGSLRTVYLHISTRAVFGIELRGR